LNFNRIRITIVIQMEYDNNPDCQATLRENIQWVIHR
jgi:hypothetical protein